MFGMFVIESKWQCYTVGAQVAAGAQISAEWYGGSYDTNWFRISKFVRQLCIFIAISVQSSNNHIEIRSTTA